MNTRIIADTRFGPVAILWGADGGAPKIVRVLLSRPGLTATDHLAASYPGVRATSCPEIDEVAAEMVRMLEGAEVEFPLCLADLSLCGQFQQRVLRAEHRIPRGAVSTYGLIARRLGRPNGARAVGNALARNPFPLIVPCHRAIRSDRSLGGYQGGIEMKRALLEAEGVEFDVAGKARCARLHYETRK